MGKMFLMTGHPGSGKSYFAKDFAKKNGFRYLSIDDMYAAFNGDPHSHDNKFDVWMTFWRQIHAAEQAGHDVVIDTNAPTSLDRAEFLNWFHEFDEHHLIWVDAPWDLCIKNNASRGRIIPLDQMREIFNMFEPPAPSTEGAGKHRSHWDSISYIANRDNQFAKRITISGRFPMNIE